MGCFDFDELDLAEQPSAPAPTLARDLGDALISEAEPADPEAAPVIAVGQRAAGDAHVRPIGKKPMSRARAWFEIRRFFEAEPQQHYGSSDPNEWKAYYAKELILKTACERLQADGFVVIDAQLAPHHFQGLVGQLCLDAPEQVAALEGHLPAGGSALRRLQSAEPDGACDAGGGPGRALVPSWAGGAASAQDEALCDGCFLSLGTGRQASSVLRPHSKQQFLRFFKTYIHEVAANSMSQDRASVRDEEKIPVQFCFGCAPPSSPGLTAPPQRLAVEESP